MPMTTDYFQPDKRIEDWAEHRVVMASCYPEMNHSHSTASGVAVAVDHDDTHGPEVVVVVEEVRHHILNNLPFPVAKWGFH